MKVRREDVNCSGHDTFRCVRYEFDYQAADSELLAELIERGEDLATSVHPRMARDTSRGRSQETRQTDSIGGVIAEYVWRDWLTTQADDYGIDVTAERRDDWESPKEQVDITMTYPDESTSTIEVRSSFPYAGFEDAVCSNFDIIGWYNNPVKEREIRKDYYARVLFPFGKDDFADELRSDNLEVYLTGGATRDLLENSDAATNDEFTPWWEDASGGSQKGDYRIIRPIVNGFDTYDFSEKVLHNAQ